MIFRRITDWLCGGKKPAIPKAETHSCSHGTTDRNGEESSGVDYRALADASDAKCATQHIDPPRPGRKTYSARHAETSNMSTSDIKASIAQRTADGKGDRCGVLLRILAERGEE